MYMVFLAGFLSRYTASFLLRPFDDDDAIVRAR